MTKVYCFVTGHEDFLGIGDVFTACAITDKGKWLAGAVSKDPKTAVVRVGDMAIMKLDNGIISGPFEMVLEYYNEDEYASEEVRTAMKLAFERMP